MILSLNLIMKKKLSILYQIYNCTSQEYGYANEDGIEQLGILIEEKQGMISEIDYLDRKFLVEFEDLKQELGIDSLDNIDGEGNEELTVLKLNTTEILEILNKIDDLDKKVQTKVSKLREDLAQELTKIKKQKDVSKIYNTENAKGAMRDLGVYDTSNKSTFDKKK